MLYNFRELSHSLSHAVPMIAPEREKAGIFLAEKILGSFDILSLVTVALKKSCGIFILVDMIIHVDHVDHNHSVNAQVMALVHCESAQFQKR